MTGNAGRLTHVDNLMAVACIDEVLSLAVLIGRHLVQISPVYLARGQQP
jgi:hypothetical protein